MTKVLSGIVLLFFVIVFAVAENSQRIKKIATLKYQSDNVFFRSEKYRYSDLFGIIYLTRFKIPNSPDKPATVHSEERNVNLYVLGDSYIAGRLQANYFRGVDSVFFVDWRDKSKNFEPGLAKNNILIIETTERTFLHKFGNRDSLKYPFIKGDIVENVTGLEENRKFSFNKEINDNLEFILFDNPWFTYLKQLRADVNYRLFGTLPGTVIISPDGKNLFLRSTVDTNYRMPTESSSFKYLPENDLNTCIENCNLISDHYKKMGYSEVYFSIIPNPVTVVGFPPYKYNELIYRLGDSPKRNFKTIDVYTDFIRYKSKVYSRSDTHWTPRGLQMWIDKVNALLVENNLSITEQIEGKQSLDKEMDKK